MVECLLQAAELYSYCLSNELSSRTVTFLISWFLGQNRNDGSFIYLLTDVCYNTVHIQYTYVCSWLNVTCSLLCLYNVYASDTYLALALSFRILFVLIVLLFKV